MRKKIIGLFLLANLGNAIEIETEIKTGFNATWGGEGISKPTSQIFEIFEVALPRDNIFDEKAPELPRFTNRSATPATFSENEKPKPIIVSSQDEADIEYAKRYVSRQVQFDKTLLDAKVKIKDYGTELGAVIKARPHRLDQGFNIFDINRLYLFANVETDKVKLNSNFYITGYENGTPGLNKYSEEGYRDPKSKFQLDTSGKVTPIDYLVSPDIAFKFQGNYEGVKDYLFSPGINIKPIDTKSHLFKVSFGYQILKNNNEDALTYSMKDIKTFAMGNRKVEYYKNWELGEPKLDTEYNKNGEKKDENGNKAYRVIGTKDPKKGHVSGLNGSIRVVGSPTGALYGQTLIEKVMSETVSILKDNIRDHELIFDTIKNKRIGLNLIGQVFKPTLKTDIEDIINNKDGKKDKLIKTVVNRVMNEINIDLNEPLSDFHGVHLIPREFRDYLSNSLPAIPYENSNANIKKRKTEKPLPEIIIIPKEHRSSLVLSPNPSSETELKVDLTKYGSTATNKGIMVVPFDSRNALLKTDFKDSIERFANIARRTEEKFTLLGLINYIKDGDAIIKDLIKGGKLKDLFFNPSNLETFDMFAGLQFNKSEHEYRQAEYQRELFSVLGDNIEVLYGDKKFDVESSRKKFNHGYRLNLEYQYKIKPLYLTFDSYGDFSKSGKEIVKKDHTVLARNVDYYEKYMYKNFPRRNFSDWISDDTKIKEKESIYNIHNDLKFRYKGEQLKLNAELNTTFQNIKFTSDRNEELKYAMFGHVGPAGVIKKNRTEYKLDFISKVNIDYSKVILNPKLNLSYEFRPSKYFYIKPSINFEGLYTKNIYNKIEFARYLKEEENSDKSKLKEIEIEIFDRDNKNNLKKFGNALPTYSPYFNELKNGESVDLSKISKYAIPDVDNAFLKKKVSGGQSNWDKLVSEIMFGLDLSINPIKHLSIGYHFSSPMVFYGKNLHGFYIRNGLSATIKF